MFANHGSPLHPLLEALASGEAPCTKTLQTKEVGGAETYNTAGVRDFLLGGLTEGCLPLLSKLVPYDEASSPEMWLRLMEACFLLFDRHGTPSRLEHLILRNGEHQIDCLETLTAVVREGGLPRLRHLAFIEGSGAMRTTMSSPRTGRSWRTRSSRRG